MNMVRTKKPIPPLATAKPSGQAPSARASHLPDSPSGRAGAAVGLTASDHASEMDTLRVLEATLGGPRFWNPVTLAQVRPGLVEAYLDEACREFEPRGVLNHFRAIQNEPLLKRIQTAKQWLGRNDDPAARAMAYAVRLPLEIILAESVSRMRVRMLGGTITWLPSDLSGLQDMGFMTCRDLTDLPDGLRSPGAVLILEWCSSLARIPNGLQVGRLSLEGCASLERLDQVGNGVVVSENLSLYGCPLQRYSDAELFKAFGSPAVRITRA